MHGRNGPRMTYRPSFTLSARIGASFRISTFCLSGSFCAMRAAIRKVSIVMTRMHTRLMGSPSSTKRIQCGAMARALITAAGIVLVASAYMNAQATPRTVWDGVYTDAQAERARGTFESTCSRCHSLTPGPAGQGGPLVGDKFWTANSQKSVGDLLAFMSKNMPNGN